MDQNQADSGAQGTQTGANGAPSAGAQEQQLSIPKWRFDELASRLRAKDEELQIKNQLLTEVQASRQAPKPQEAQELTAEELGLDPQAFQAIMKVAQATVRKGLEPEVARLRAQLGHLGNQSEETQFLMKNGSEQSRYLARIREMRAMHYQRTGGFLDMDSAFKMLRYDEMTSRGQGSGQNSGSAADASGVSSRQGAQEGYFPNADLTRQGSSVGAQAQKSFEELSVDEQEALIEDRIRQGSSV